MFELTGPHHCENNVAIFAGFPVAAVKSPVTYSPFVLFNGSDVLFIIRYAAAVGFRFRLSGVAVGSVFEISMEDSDAATEEYAQQRFVEP